MALNNREKKILAATLITGAIALIYIYIIEPRIAFVTIPEEVSNKYKGYISLLEAKDEIEKRFDELISSKYWKNNVDEQQVGFQAYLEKIGRDTGLKEVISIRPLSMKETPPYHEIAFQMDVRASIYSLSLFLYKLGTAPLPVQIKKLQIYSEETNPEQVKSQIVAVMLWVKPEKMK